jgi:hypothetical protein
MAGDYSFLKVARHEVGRRSNQPAPGAPVRREKNKSTMKEKLSRHQAE